MQIWTWGARKLALGLLLATSMAATAVAAQRQMSWAVMDAKTGRIIADEGGKTMHPPASLAKMMTLYLTFEALRSGRLHWDDKIKMSSNAASKVRMKLNVKAGTTITVREAVNSMIIISANDAATAMGEHLAGSEAAFGRMMTEKARRLGMKSTIFVTPSGLTAKTRQVTTPEDMARLGLALKRDFPANYQLFAQRTYNFRGRVLHGHNNLMYRYAGVDGIKTGYTDASGYNLVSSLNADGRRLIGVVLGGPTARSRDDKMAALLNKYSKASIMVAEQEEKKPRAKTVKLASAPMPEDRPTKIGAKGKHGDEVEIEQGDGGETVAEAGAGRWKLQVGTSSTRDGANDLKEKAEDALKGAKGEIVSSGKGKSHVYKVRLGGFKSSADANKACSNLKKQRMDCFAVSSR
ncbi:D-alanyl-D-alanine carboxypeptidase [Rhizobium oryzicola]|uniref:D-alanyl-D-alanine carboxypeptidase n=1 Tax=Rhizobium oryzicola TaxID=1232668 RepID=A0ABT8T1F6_9HYPH|nr:D-alanyl-D-alanine carboxypeptidase [Rhizobium oryzicola]MDO1583717.1 D-alanyl-D-alanine carboxypeptidase [Rhizobium oryzicola]